VIFFSRFSIILSLIIFASCSSLDPDRPFTPQKQDEIVPKTAKLKLLWKDGSFTEGPTIDKNGAVLFTDIRNNRIMKYDPDLGSVAIYRTQSNSANGLAMTKDGMLIACEGADGGTRRLTITNNSGKIKVLTDNYQGKKFNSPNDVTVAVNNDIYFTDPRYKARPEEKRELDFEGVFLVRNGKTTVATKEVERPNGILISKDGKTAFLSDNNNTKGGAKELLKFKIQKDGTFTDKEVLFRFKQNQRGIDGMTLGSMGNIYATAGKGKESGVYILSPEGEHLAYIQLPDKPTNCTFGGASEANTLYITCQVKRQPNDYKKFGLFKIKLNKKR
jgi:sugar lactone lactonase YvrE